MKKLIYLLTLTLFICMSCSKDDPIESVEQIETSSMEYSKVVDYILKQNNSAKGSLNKGGNNGNGVFFVPYSSNVNELGIVWRATMRIPGTMMLMYIDYPQNGEDRALLYPDGGIQMNFNVKNPKLFIADFSDGPPIVKYSNWCDENRTGLYRERLKSDDFIPLDFNGDGKIDVYWLDINGGSSIKPGGMLHVKATLTDAQNSEPGVFPVEGDCKEPTEKVEFSVMWQHKTLSVTLDGVKYSN